VLPNRHKVPDRKLGAKMATKLIPSDVFNVVCLELAQYGVHRRTRPLDARDATGTTSKTPAELMLLPRNLELVKRLSFGDSIPYADTSN